MSDPKPAPTNEELYEKLVKKQESIVSNLENKVNFINTSRDDLNKAREAYEHAAEENKKTANEMMFRSMALVWMVIILNTLVVGGLAYLVLAKTL